MPKFPPSPWRRTPSPAPDDLLALADEVREVGLTWDLPEGAEAASSGPGDDLRLQTGVVELADPGVGHS